MTPLNANNGMMKVKTIMVKAGMAVVALAVAGAGLAHSC